MDEVPQTIRCRQCQTVFPTNSVTDDDEEALPELPKIRWRKAPKRDSQADVDAESRSAGKRKKREPKPQQQLVSTLIVVLVATLVLWGVFGVVGMLPGLEVLGIGGLVIHALVFLAWGIGGISLVVQEENENHGLICWSSLLLLLSPVIPCIALISLVGLMMVLFYGLTRIHKTALYVVLISLSIVMLTFVGIVGSQMDLPK